MNYKLASTDALIGLCTEANLNNYNRQVDIAELCRIIDPDGIHVGEVIILHEHAAGVKVDPHYRTQWMVKRKGTMEPVNCWIDVSIDSWNNLPSHKVAIDSE